jgi:hypothetical protein
VCACNPNSHSLCDDESLLVTWALAQPFQTRVVVVHNFVTMCHHVWWALAMCGSARGPDETASEAVAHGERPQELDTKRFA